MGVVILSPPTGLWQENWPLSYVSLVRATYCAIGSGQYTLLAGRPVQTGQVLFEFKFNTTQSGIRSLTRADALSVSTTSMGFNYVYGFNYLTYLIKSVPGFKDVKIRKLESEASVEFIPKERFCFANSFLSLVFRVEWSTDINLRTLHIPGVPRFLDR